MAQKNIKKNVDSISSGDLVDDGVLYLGKRKREKLSDGERGNTDGDESSPIGTIFDWETFKQRTDISNIEIKVPIINTIRFWRLNKSWGFAIGDYNESKDQWITKIRFYNKNGNIVPTHDCIDYIIEGFDIDDSHKVHKFVKSFVV